MAKQIFPLSALTLTCCLLLSAGCGGGREKPKDLPPLHPGTLTFEQEGVPLGDAHIILHSDSKWAVSGRTNEKGEVKLVTGGFYDGVPEGTYKIIVRKSVVVEDETTGNTIRRTNVVAPQFTQANTTPLEIEIVKGRNSQTFDLGKAVSVNVPVERN